MLEADCEYHFPPISCLRTHHQTYKSIKVILILNLWHLSKNSISLSKGGSILCFGVHIDYPNSFTTQVESIPNASAITNSDPCAEMYFPCRICPSDENFPEKFKSENFLENFPENFPCFL
jgi:hypothetical protein